MESNTLDKELSARIAMDEHKVGATIAGIVWPTRYRTRTERNQNLEDYTLSRLKFIALCPLFIMGIMFGLLIWNQ
jgi:hypothetical protein